MNYNGVINIYKEQGMTSFQVVYKVRKLLNVKKVGHTGTLDPLAEGVLLICVGKATRASSYIMDGVKEYVCTMVFGYETTTLDREGEIIKTAEKTQFSEDIVISSLNSFLGESLQIPPIYSAIKVNGKKLYQYARNEIDVKIEPRKINILSITLNNIEKNSISFTVVCHKGTYIRSLCRDVAYKLGTVGTMTHLIRTKTGAFIKEDSITLAKLDELVSANKEESVFIDPTKHINLPLITLSLNETEDYILGKKILLKKQTGEYLIADSNNLIMGIGILSSEGMLKSKKRLI